MIQPFYRDREIIRQSVPVIVGAVLGALLTGIPTVWIALSQQRLQLELATRADREQRRQRKIAVLKNQLATCMELTSLSDRMVFAAELKTKRTIETIREFQTIVNDYILSLTELSAEFEMIGLAPKEELSALMAGFDPPDNLSSPQAREEALRASIQRSKPLLVSMDRGCRAVSNKLLQLLLSEKQN